MGGNPVISKLECNHCHYEWYPRTPNKPKVCPNCKHRDWEKKKEVKDVKRKGRTKGE